MNIYSEGDEETIVDLAAARDELKRSDGMRDERRRMVVAEVTAAALLDIAASLRFVGTEAAIALTHTLGAPTEADAAEEHEVADLVVVGDLVAVNGYDEPGEVIGFGVDQDEQTVSVRFASGAEVRTWLAAVTRLVGDERDDDAMQDASEAETPPVDPEANTPPADPEDLGDDIDDDFDGDEHPAAASALDVLKENERQRKAAKKKGKK